MRMSLVRTSVMLLLFASFSADMSLAMTESSKNDKDCKSALTDTEGPQFFDLFLPMNPKSERFVKIMKQGLNSRFIQEEEVQSLIQELHLTDVGSSRTQIDVEWKIGRARLVKRKEFGKVIYTIESITALEDGAELPYGTKPRRPSMLLPRILSAMTQAIRLDALENPAILRAEVVMGAVVNEGLLALIREMGFQEVRSQSGNPPRTFGARALPMDTGSGFARTSVPPLQGPPSFIMSFIRRN